MVSIGSLRYDIIADTAQFQKGMVATRRELSTAKKLFWDTRTPAERLGMEIDGLNRLVRKGAIDQKTYNRAVKDLKHQADVASGGLRGMKAEIKNASASMKTLVKSFLLFQATRGVINIGREELVRIDEVAKTSRKLGILTDDLIALRLAGEQLANIGEKQVDVALQRMTRRIAEAAKGTGEAQKALEELGLSAQQLNTMGPGQAFRVIADAVANLSSEQDRLRIAFKLFDSEGAALVNVLAAGSDGVDQFAKKAHDLGLTFENDVAAQVESANDALSDARHAFRGGASDLTTFFVPAIETAANAIQGLGFYFNEARKGAEELAESMVIPFFGARMAPTLGDTPGTSDPNFGQRGMVPPPETPIDQTAIEEEEDRQKAIREEIDAIREKSEAQLRSREEQERYLLRQMGATEEQVKQLKHAQEMRKVLERWRKEEEQLEASRQEQRDRLKSLADQIREDVKSPFDRLVDDLADVKVLVDIGAIDQRTADMAQQNALDAMRDQRKPVKVELPDVAQRGSREEFRILSQIRQQQASQDERRHRETMDLRRAMLEAQQEANRRLENLEAEAVG